jgi:oligopeptide/dipeptide ABC transporter ATP-binding protein
LESMPSYKKRTGKLKTIEGTVPNPLHLPKGCRFAPRCEFAKGLCRAENPPLIPTGDNEVVRCWKYSERWEENIYEPNAV